MINPKDWNKTMESIEEWLSSHQGSTKNLLNCVVCPEIAASSEADDDRDDCDLLEDEFVERALTA